MKEKITVVIPTYNRSALLIRCIKALEKQSLAASDFEVIVVSDGVDAVTRNALFSIIKESSLTIKYLHTAEKQGPAGARNLGWLSAKTPLIAFTDDDCIPSKDWLASLLEYFKEGKYLALTGKTIVPLPEDPSDFAINIAHLEDADFITANCACTKAALLKVGGFDERFKMAWREDSDLEFKLLTNEIPIQKVNRAIVIHPVRDVAWGVSIKEQKKGLYDALLFKKFPVLYRSKIQASPIWNNYLTTLLALLFIVSLFSGTSTLTAIIFFILVLQFGRLIFRRLKRLNKSFSHVTEMIATSLVIPFLSVYWRIYGAIKYKVLFL